MKFKHVFIVILVIIAALYKTYIVNEKKNFCEVIDKLEVRKVFYSDYEILGELKPSTGNLEDKYRMIGFSNLFNNNTLYGYIYDKFGPGIFDISLTKLSYDIINDKFSLHDNHIADGININPVGFIGGKIINEHLNIDLSNVKLYAEGELIFESDKLTYDRNEENKYYITYAESKNKFYILIGGNGSDAGKIYSYDGVELTLSTQEINDIGKDVVIRRDHFLFFNNIFYYITKSDDNQSIKIINGNGLVSSIEFSDDRYRYIFDYQIITDDRVIVSELTDYGFWFVLYDFEGNELHRLKTQESSIFRRLSDDILLTVDYTVDFEISIINAIFIKDDKIIKKEIKLENKSPIEKIDINENYIVFSYMDSLEIIPKDKFIKYYKIGEYYKGSE